MEPLSENLRQALRSATIPNQGIDCRLVLVSRFTQQIQSKRTEFPVYVLYGIHSYATAENPAHIGLERHADNLGFLLCFKAGNDVVKMPRRKMADIIAFLAYIGSAGAPIGNNEHEPTFGAPPP